MPQRVPFGILAQVVRPGGMRLPKLQNLLPVTDIECKWKPYVPVMNPPKPTGMVVVNKPHERFGNLPFDEYRLFVGTSFDSGRGENWARCRGCDTHISTLEGRSIHRWSCKTLILEAIKLLHADKACAICDTRTSLTKWGVPLCSDNCHRMWMMCSPAAFKDARELALKRNPALERKVQA